MKYNITILCDSNNETEVIAQTIKVLQAIAMEFDHQFLFKKVYLKSTDSNGLPQKTVETCKKSDVILMDSLPSTTDYQLEENLLMLCIELGLYASVHPVKAFRPLLDKSPVDNQVIFGTDIIIFTEQLNRVTSSKSDEQKGTTMELAQVQPTRHDIERISHKAFKTAQSRNKKVTLVHGVNGLENSHLWRAVATDISSEYNEVAVEFLSIEKTVVEIITNPLDFDVILCDRIFGSVLIHQSIAVTGSLGLSTRAYLGDKLGLFAPVNNSSIDDHKAKNIKNPIASILSAAMLLEHLGLYGESEMVKTAVDRSLELNITTPDLNSFYNNITTSKVGDFITDFIMNPHDSNTNFNNIHLGQSTII